MSSKSSNKEQLNKKVRAERILINKVTNNNSNKVKMRLRLYQSFEDNTLSGKSIEIPIGLFSDLLDKINNVRL